MDPGIIKCHSGSGCIRSWTHLSPVRGVKGTPGPLVPDLSEFMSDAKLRACSCGTEIRLAWKFEKAAPKTTSVIVDPAGLVDTASDCGTASLVDTASGRWPGGRQPSPCVTSVTSVTSSPTALVTFWLRYLPLSEPHSRSVTSVTSFFPGFF